MSAPTSKEQILFEQRILACGKFYTGALDGLWGKKSEAAAQTALLTYEAIKQNFGVFDSRSEKNIATLLPAVQKMARQLLKAAPPNTKILSGTRSYAEQDALFSQRPVVTRARGGQSWHNFGTAVDIGLFDSKGKYLTGATRTEEKAYADAAKQIKAAVPGIAWGGDWKGFVDTPHYYFNTGLTIAQTRQKFEAGKLFL